MKICTFFGHKDCRGHIDPILYAVIEELIVTEKVCMFYVGHQGQFDGKVRRILRQLENRYSHISYAVVLAYMPGTTREYENYEDTMLPEGIEAVHPKYAITWRNNWMLKRSDYVITYITHHFGGAAQFADKAVRQKKSVFNITGSYDALPEHILERILFNARDDVYPLTSDELDTVCDELIARDMKQIQELEKEMFVQGAGE